MDIKEALLKGCKKIRQSEGNGSIAKQSNNNSEESPQTSSILNEKTIRLISEKIAQTSQAKQNEQILKQFSKIAESKTPNNNHSHPIDLDDEDVILTPQQIEELNPNMVDEKRAETLEQTRPQYTLTSTGLVDLQEIDVRALIERLGLNKPGDLKQWADEDYTDDLLRLELKKAAHPKIYQKVANGIEKDKHTKEHEIQAPNHIRMFEQKKFVTPVQNNQPPKPNKIELKNPNSNIVNVKQIPHYPKNQGKPHKNGADISPTIRDFLNAPSKTSSTKVIPGQKIDLAKQSLPGLVKLCYKDGVIKKDLFDAFVNNHRTENMLKFIELFQKQDVDSFDFSSALITIFEHRRLTEILRKIHPSKYMFTNLSTSLSKVDKFLKQVYDIQDSDYKQILGLLDQKSGIKWWEHVMRVIQRKSKSPSSTQNGIKQKFNQINSKPRMNYQLQKQANGKAHHRKDDNDSSSLSSEGNTNGHTNGRTNVYPKSYIKYK